MMLSMARLRHQDRKVWGKSNRRASGSTLTAKESNADDASESWSEARGRDIGALDEHVVKGDSPENHEIVIDISRVHAAHTRSEHHRYSQSKQQQQQQRGEEEQPRTVRAAQSLHIRSNRRISRRGKEWKSMIFKLDNAETYFSSSMGDLDLSQSSFSIESEPWAAAAPPRGGVKQENPPRPRGLSKSLSFKQTMRSHKRRPWSNHVFKPDCMLQTDGEGRVGGLSVTIEEEPSTLYGEGDSRSALELGGMPEQQSREECKDLRKEISFDASVKDFATKANQSDLRLQLQKTPSDLHQSFIFKLAEKMHTPIWNSLENEKEQGLDMTEHSLEIVFDTDGNDGTGPRFAVRQASSPSECGATRGTEEFKKYLWEKVVAKLESWEKEFDAEFAAKKMGIEEKQQEHATSDEEAQEQGSLEGFEVQVKTMKEEFDEQEGKTKDREKDTSDLWDSLVFKPEDMMSDVLPEVRMTNKPESSLRYSINHLMNLSAPELFPSRHDVTTRRSSFTGGISQQATYESEKKLFTPLDTGKESSPVMPEEKVQDGCVPATVNMPAFDRISKSMSCMQDAKAPPKNRLSQSVPCDDRIGQQPNLIAWRPPRSLSPSPSFDTVPSKKSFLKSPSPLQRAKVAVAFAGNFLVRGESLSSWASRSTRSTVSELSMGDPVIRSQQAELVRRLLIGAGNAQVDMEQTEDNFNFDPPTHVSVHARNGSMQQRYPPSFRRLEI